jgi:hypothetical protein
VVRGAPVLVARLCVRFLTRNAGSSASAKLSDFDCLLTASVSPPRKQVHLLLLASQILCDVRSGPFMGKECAETSVQSLRNCEAAARGSTGTERQLRALDTELQRARAVRVVRDVSCSATWWSDVSVSLCSIALAADLRSLRCARWTSPDYAATPTARAERIHATQRI